MILQSVAAPSRHQPNCFSFGVGHDLPEAAPVATEVHATISEYLRLRPMPMEAVGESHNELVDHVDL